jgi:transcriptional regulator with XRE-family HTH domain
MTCVTLCYLDNTISYASSDVKGVLPTVVLVAYDGCVVTNVAGTRSQSASEIRRLREGRQWTQQDLASRLGVSRARIGQIETGTGAPMSEDLLNRINDLLGVRLQLDAPGPRRRPRPAPGSNRALVPQHGHPGLARAREPFDEWTDNLSGTFAPMRFAIPDLDPRTMWSKVIDWAIDEQAIRCLRAIQGDNPTWWWGKRSNSAKRYHVKTLEFVRGKQSTAGFSARRIYVIDKPEHVLSDETVRRRFAEQVFCEHLEVGVARRVGGAPYPGMLLVDTPAGASLSDNPGPLVVRLDGPDDELTTSAFSAIRYDIEKGRGDFEKLSRRAEWIRPEQFAAPVEQIPAGRVLELVDAADDEWERSFCRLMGKDDGYLRGELPAEIERCLRAAGRHRRERR